MFERIVLDELTERAFKIIWSECLQTTGNQISDLKKLIEANDFSPVQLVILKELESVELLTAASTDDLGISVLDHLDRVREGLRLVLQLVNEYFEETSSCFPLTEAHELKPCYLSKKRNFSLAGQEELVRNLELSFYDGIFREKGSQKRSISLRCETSAFKIRTTLITVIPLSSLYHR